MDDRILPAGFEVLEPFVGQWAVVSTAVRDQCRSQSLPAERDAFFQSMGHLLEPALALLDQTPLTQMAAAEQRLMQLVLGFAHVAMAVEIHGDKEATHAGLRARMRITRSPADE